MRSQNPDDPAVVALTKFDGTGTTGRIAFRITGSDANYKLSGVTITNFTGANDPPLICQGSVKVEKCVIDENQGFYGGGNPGQRRAADH